MPNILKMLTPLNKIRIGILSQIQKRYKTSHIFIAYEMELSNEPNTFINKRESVSGPKLITVKDWQLAYIK